MTTTVTDVTPTPTAEVTPEPTEAPPSETTPPPPPTTSPPPTTPPPPTLPEGVSPCPAVYGPVGGFTISAAGNDVTSCPFAEEVRRSYGANPTRNAPVVIPAFSPVTGVTYEMRCTGDGLVTCTGGNNAVVHLI
ncbi:MAG: hypothetical protein Q4F67_00335 [Propionibacteriaceae bacterium]|nr:hypothetical protein [Propionibacteriaceae bacterium]